MYSENKISVILPAYNEGKLIGRVIQEAAGYLDSLGRVYEIIVVDDGSADDTLPQARAAADKHSSVKIVALPENMGKGHALRRGFYASSGELVCFLDADLDLHPSNMTSLLQDMERKNADIVIGSKRHPESRLSYPWYRKLFSNVYFLLILLLFRMPIKDTQTGIKVFKRDVLEKLFPRIVCKQYAFDLELLALANRMGYRIAEAPIVLDFQGKFGRIRWADIRNIMLDTFAIFYRMHILRYYDTHLAERLEREPSVAVVVPSKGLDEMSSECIEKCGYLDYGPYEIIFVPDEIIEIPPTSSRLRVIPSGPVGPSMKRNLAAEKTDAEILAFIDSDAWPDVEWLRNSVPYLEDENTAAVCGPMVTPPRDSLRQRSGGLVYSSSLVSNGTIYRYLFRKMREVDDYPSCNLIVRKADFEKAGGYPVEYWPGEDTVLCLRITRELKKKIIYVPNVIVYHHRRPLFLQHLRQVWSYASHRGYFVKRFPQTSRKLAYFVPSLFVGWVCAGLALSFVDRALLYVYAGSMGLYLFLCLLSSLRSIDIRASALVFLGTILTNITYGVGFAVGLLARRMEKGESSDSVSAAS